jgi:signal transduction histidine kinase
VIAGVDRRLAIGLIATGGLVVAGIATRLARTPEAGETATAALPLLVAVASLLVAVLAVRRAPGLAWPAAVVAAVLAVREPVALAGAAQGAAGAADAWLPAALLVGLTSTTAVGVTALYATTGDPMVRIVGLGAWGLVAWQAIGAGASIALSLAGRRDEPAGFQLFHVVTAPVAYWPVLPFVLGAVGAFLALRGPVRRAAAGREQGMRPGDLPRVAGALGDELLGRAASRRATAQGERARLAAELHADVLPALRAAVADLEAGRDPATVGARLAAIAADVQALSLERRNLILEELGLVAALEAMAERVEERADASVEIDVDAGAAEGGAPLSARPPLPVERGALRVAELAVANATRHGTGPVRLTVASDSARVRVVVANDGPAFDAEAARAAVRRGARGLTEMREAAAEVDADLQIGPGADGGAVVRFVWPRG